MEDPEQQQQSEGASEYSYSSSSTGSFYSSGSSTEESSNTTPSTSAPAPAAPTSTEQPMMVLTTATAAQVIAPAVEQQSSSSARAAAAENKVVEGLRASESSSKLRNKILERGMSRRNLKATLDSEMTVSEPWNEERECMLLLLRARVLLRKLVETKLYEQRLARGALSAVEVHSLVHAQQQEEETDFVKEIEMLKRNLMADIRQNHVLEKDRTDMDKRIGLLIHNVESLAPSKSKKGRGGKGRGGGASAGGSAATITQAKMEHYTHLFYLLQTEPKYLARLVGCMAEEEGVDELLDTILLTLFGDAFSPREENLILRLFELAIQYEMTNAFSVTDFVKEQSILAKMVMTYNKRKQGVEFMKTTLGPVLKDFLRTTASIGSLEVNPRKIHQKLVRDQETATGVKSTIRNLTTEEILALPEVASVVAKRIEQLQAACQLFLDKIFSSVSHFPYGLRWIVNRHRFIAQDKLTVNDPDDLNKMTSYFVYYRFINLGVVSPETFNIVDSKVPDQAIFNLVEVGKVLHHLFSFTPFDIRTEKAHSPLNEWMVGHYADVRRFLTELLDVKPPEDFLQVDRYMELTQMVKPTILISAGEIADVHRFVTESVDRIATGGAEDPLRVILRELGPPEAYEDYDRPQLLTLVNRFPSSVEEQMADNSGTVLFNQTKAAVISVLRQLPNPLPVIRTKGEQPTLVEILRAGAKWAQSENNDKTLEAIEKVRKNLEDLEKLGLVTGDQNHRELLKAVTLEIANRAQIREQQNKELARLQVACRKAQEQQKYLNDQLAQYNQYLQVVRSRHVGGVGSKHKSKKQKVGGAAGKIMGPFKFSYMDLVKQGVIVESEVPKPLQKATKISISSEEPGVFDVEVRIPAMPAATMKLKIDDLLDKQSKNMEHDEEANITLDVNMSIHLLNKLFKK